MDFLIAKDDLHRCRFDDGPAPRARSRPGAAARRALRPERRTTSPTRCSARRCPTGASSRPRRAGGACRCGALPRSPRAASTQLEPGTRVYGYLPPSSELVVAPARVDAHGFVDASPHRASLPAAYNGYARVDADPIYDARHGGPADAAAPAVLHLVPDRRLPRRRLAVRREHGRALERLEQDRQRARVPALAPRRGRGDRPDLARAAPTSPPRSASTTASSPTTRSTRSPQRSARSTSTWPAMRRCAATVHCPLRRCADALGGRRRHPPRPHGRRAGLTAGPRADVLLRARPRRQAHDRVGPRRLRSAASPRPGDRTCEWCEGWLEVVRGEGPRGAASRPTSTCSTGASTRPRRTCSRSRASRRRSGARCDGARVARRSSRAARLASNSRYSGTVSSSSVIASPGRNAATAPQASTA